MLIWFAVCPAQAGSQVRVDPQVELLQALFRASGSEEFRDEDSDYTRALDAMLAEHSDHRAIEATKAIRLRYAIGYNAPASLALYEGEEFTAPLRPFPPGLDDRWNHPGPVRRWLSSVRAFEEDIGWDSWIASHRPEFEELEHAWTVALAEEDMISWFTATFGDEPSIYVHPSPTSGQNNFGASVIGPDGALERHAVLGSGPWSTGHLEVLVHEVAHSYVHPIADDHPDLGAASEAVLGLLGPEMSAQAYGVPKIVANETLTRAIVQLYLRDRHPERAIADLAHNDAASFLWIFEVANALEAARSGPETLLDLAAAAQPTALAMKAWAERPAQERIAPFRGTSNAAFGRVALMVTPKEGELAAYAGQIHAKFLAARGVGLAQANTITAMPDGGMIAYGSPSSNPWVAQIAALAKWSIGPDGIALDGRWFPGEHLVLIACWPHPSNPRAALSLYAGATDADVIGINAAFHGPDDWLVMRRRGSDFEVVARGMFEKSAAAWSLPSPPPAPLLDPASVGIDPSALDTLITRAVASKSDALIVWVDGKTVVRWPEVQQPIETMSMTKSIVSLGIGQLLAEGRIPSLDTRANRWLPAWKRGDHAPITLRMLLEHTSGLATVPSRDIYAAPDIIALATATPLTTAPGSTWAYNNSAANLVTAIGSAAAGVPFDKYMEEHLFTPLGLTPLGLGPREWTKDPAGNVHGGAGLALTADDLLRVGQLMLAEGRWEGRQLVEAEWIHNSVAPNQVVKHFGQQWWPIWDEGRVVGFRADGWLGQVLVVLPEEHLVAVRQMRATEAHWRLGDEGVDTFRDFHERVLDLR